MTARRDYGGGFTLRSQGKLPWPGITEPRDSRCSCTWAMREGQMQVKYLNRACTRHGRLLG